VPENTLHCGDNLDVLRDPDSMDFGIGAANVATTLPSVCMPTALTVRSGDTSPCVLPAPSVGG